MRFPFHLFHVYKASKKATVVSAASLLLCVLLVVVPAGLMIWSKGVSPMLGAVSVLCFGAAICIFMNRTSFTNHLAEQDLLKGR